MFDSDDHIFPSKPELISQDRKSQLVKFGLSVLLFVAVFFSVLQENFLFVCEIVGILLFHELGHFIAIKLYGYKSVNMMFIPFIGAMVSGNAQKISQKQRINIALLGPLPGILVGSVMLMLFLNGNQNAILLEVSLLLLVINVLNLSPLDPLDGGHIIEALFFPKNDNSKMYFTLISSLVVICLGWYLDFLILMLFGFFMAFKVRGFQKSQRIYQDLQDIEFNYTRPYEKLTNKDYWTLRRVFLDNNPKIKDIIPSEMVLWENERLIVDQIKQLLKLEITLDLKIGQKIAYFMVYLISVAIPSYLVYNNWPIIINFIESQNV